MENGPAVAAWKAGFTTEGTEGAEEGDKQGRGVAGGEPDYGGALKECSPRRREGNEEQIGISIGIGIETANEHLLPHDTETTKAR